MPFFDKKEDVLDIKLTPYGRHLLSRGKLMPSFYSFLDDDVVYDIRSSHQSDSEQNSEVKQRIINETPSLTPNYSFNSVETELSDNPTKEAEGDQFYTFGNEEITEDQYFSIYELNYRPIGDVNTKFLQNTLGTSQQGSEKAPRWDVFFVRGEINTNNTYNHTSSIPSNSETPFSASALHIPQINFDITYTMQVKNIIDDPIQDTPNREPPEVYGNNYVNVDEEQALMRILEKNGFLHDDSFEIEVFEVNEDNTLKQLKFLDLKNRVSSYIIDRDILIEDTIQPTLQPDKNTVEYYFDLRVDEEIPIFDICQGLDELKSEGLYIQDLQIECPDVLPGEGTPDTSDGDSGPVDPCEDVECDD